MNVLNRTIAAASFAPLRSLQDIEELERVPLEQRLLSWDANDWIRHGLDLAPDKVAIHYIEDGNPESPAVLGVRGIPALFMFKDGEVVSNKVGAAPKAALETWIKSAI